MRIALTPPRCSPPWPGFSHGAASHATPKNPSSSALIVIAVGRAPPGQAHSVSTMKSGLTPISSAVMPDGRYCSDHATRPLPPSSRKVPMIALVRHWRSVGQAAPRIFRNASSSAPAVRKRTPAMRKGGIDSTATRMPRYVLPQIR